MAEPVVATVGSFDGVHRGHQALIGGVVERARHLGLRSLCVTFDPLPRLVLQPERPTPVLSGRAEKVERIRQLGVDEVLVLTFSRELAQLDPEEFVALLQERHSLAEFWMGTDFALGRDRMGTVAVLAEIARRAGFAVHIVPPFRIAGQIVSSSAIRAALAEGDLDRAATYLGRRYAVTGTVVAGAARGHSLGFPTANVAVPPERALPADGVYAALARTARGEVVPAAVNLGGRPTFNEHARLLEAHLLDWSGDLYGQELTIEFVARLRGVARFGSVDELRAQIERDVAATRAALSGA